MAYFANDVRVIDDNAEVKTNEIRVTGDLIVEDPNNYDATSGSLINYEIPPAGAANSNGAYSGGLYIRAGYSRLGQGWPASNLWSDVTYLVIGYYDSSGTDVSSQVGSIKVGDVVYVEMTSTSYAFFEITSTFQNGTNAWINGVTHLSSTGSGNAAGDNDPVKLRYGITGYQWKIRPPTSYTTGQTLYLPNSSSFGGLLQVQSTYNTDYVSQYIPANTQTNVTNMSVTITPSSTSSKVLIMVNWAGEVGTSAWNSTAGLKRGTTQIGQPQSTGSTYAGNIGITGPYGAYQSDNNSTGEFVNFQYLDSPSTTSATTYYFTMGNQTAHTLKSGGVYGWSTGQTVSYERFGYGMMALEIAG